jgi:hypothetical protein
MSNGDGDSIGNGLGGNGSRQVGTGQVGNTGNGEGIGRDGAWLSEGRSGGDDVVRTVNAGNAGGVRDKLCGGNNR